MSTDRDTNKPGDDAPKGARRRGRPKKTNPAPSLSSAAEAGTSRRPRRFFTQGETNGTPADVEREAEAVLYWVGTFDDCPVQNVTLGGISFPRYTERVIDDGGMITKRSPARGAMTWLSPDQVDRIETAIKNRIVRWRGRGAQRRGTVALNRAGDARYRKMTGDEPLGHYVYMTTVEDAINQAGATWQQGFEPSPVLDPPPDWIPPAER